MDLNKNNKRGIQCGSDESPLLMDMESEFSTCPAPEEEVPVTPTSSTRNAANLVTTEGFNSGDSFMEMDEVDSNSKEEEDEELDKSQRAVWEVSQPSDSYLNKLDGWSPHKVNSGSKYVDSQQLDFESIQISDVEKWLKENLAESYQKELNNKGERRKSRVRWADVESRLQSLGFGSGLEASSQLSAST